MMISAGFMAIAFGLLFCSFRAVLAAMEADNIDDKVLRIIGSGALLVGAAFSASMSGAAFIVGLVS